MHSRHIVAEGWVALCARDSCPSVPTEGPRQALRWTRKAAGAHIGRGKRGGAHAHNLRTSSARTSGLLEVAGGPGAASVGAAPRRRGTMAGSVRRRSAPPSALSRGAGPHSVAFGTSRLIHGGWSLRSQRGLGGPAACAPLARLSPPNAAVSAAAVAGLSPFCR